MKDPKWLSLSDVQKIHQKSIERFGGSDGVRDPGLLESALARPHNLFAYEGVQDIHQLAAAYAEGVARNHPFVDGNKRTGFASADVFLKLNGHNLQPEKENEHTSKMESLSQGKITRDAMARHLKMYSQPRERQKGRGDTQGRFKRLERLQNKKDKTKDRDHER